MGGRGGGGGAGSNQTATGCWGEYFGVERRLATWGARTLWTPNVPDISTTQDKSLIPLPSFHSSGYIYCQNCPALTGSYILLTKSAGAAVQIEKRVKSAQRIPK